MNPVDEYGGPWIDRLLKAGRALGMNEVKLRWRLLRWQQNWHERRSRAREAATHVAYQHALCPECGRVLPRGTRRCTGCDARVSSRPVQLLRRIGLISPVPLSVSTLVGAAIALAFIRQVAASGMSLMSFDGQVLLSLGAHYPPLEHAGQWWRVGTAILLHGGLMHVAFNVLALAQVGPLVEDLFGRGRTLFFFMLTGVLAFLPTALPGTPVLSVGASGAVMGLIGIGAGWGQRQGTTLGRTLRNQMLKWLLYTTLFGLMFRVDHVAHVTGFLSGAAIGFLIHERRRGRQSALDVALGVVGGIALLACLGIILAQRTVGMGSE